MTTELERAAQIDADIKAADKARKDAARADADAGEKLDEILKYLDSLGKRMDAYDDAKRKDEDSDEPTAKSYPPSDMDPLNTDEPDKPRPLGADSRSDSIRADAEEIEFFQKEIGATRPVVADSVLAHIQSAADQASSAWGKSAEHPWQGESIVAYRRRVARPHQSYSAAWRDVDLATLSGQALRNATAQIFSDSIAASCSPASYGEEVLREVRRRDPDTGHLVKEYYGQPRAWLRQFAGGPPRLARFNLDGVKRG
jgi:hypothetical protein